MRYNAQVELRASHKMRAQRVIIKSPVCSNERYTAAAQDSVGRGQHRIGPFVPKLIPGRKVVSRNVVAEEKCELPKSGNEMVA